MTENNLLTELDQLTAEPEEETEQSENTPTVVVTEMNKKKLAIKIKVLNSYKYILVYTVWELCGKI